MKKKILLTSILTLALAMGVGTAAFSSRSIAQVFAYNDGDTFEGGVSYTSVKQAPLDLHNDAEAEIKDYYNSLNNVSINERKGQSLLKHLKPILQNGSKFTSYDNTRKWLMVTDRDWIQSPIENPNEKYTYPKDLATAPKVHVLYRTDNGESTALTFAGVHNGDGALLDKEHTWPKACGFKANYKTSAPGTDLHHLMLADDGINQQGHSNYPYGDINTPTINSNSKTTKTSNTYGIGYVWADTSGHSYFEPQDQDKGDIARAMLYMVARYNNLAEETMVESSGSLVSEANLGLRNMGASTYDTSTIESTSLIKAEYGDLATLLRWHKLDPVSDYEIHRNNLIDNNYQNNRNPFIDYPEWVDYIWGNVEGYAQPNTDTISQYGKSGMTIEGASLVTLGNNETYSANISGITGNNTIIWKSSNASVATINDSGELTPVSEGTITVSAITKDSTFYAEKEITISADTSVHVTDVNLNKTALTLTNGDTYKLVATVLPEAADNKNVSWESSNTNVLTVNNGILTSKQAGSATVTVTTEDGNHTATCDVTVNPVPTPVENEYTLAFGKSSSESSALTTSNFLTNGNIIENELVSSISEASKCYKGYDGLKIGTSSAFGSFNASVSSSITKEITRITIKTEKYSTDNAVLKLTINGTEEIPTAINAGTDYSYSFETPTDISSFKIETTSKKRAYIQSITFSAKESDGITPISDVVSVCKELAKGASTAEEYTIQGTVTGIIGNSFFVQQGTYGMYVYNYHLSGVEVGKVVQLTSTFQNYNGQFETKTVSSGEVLDEEEGEQINPVVINSTSEFNNDMQNTVISLRGLTFKSGDAYDASKNQSFVYTLANGVDTVTYRTNIFVASSEKTAIRTKVDASRTNATVNFVGVHYVVYNSNHQINVCSADRMVVVPNGSTDKELVQSFVDNYMHMTDYDPELTGEGTDDCLGLDGYYMKAKRALTVMTSAQINTFRIDSDFANAKARYEAWASAYGDSTPYSTNVTPTNLLKSYASNDYVPYVILAVSLVTTIGLAILIQIRKKKEQ